jgi:hypothetical protein
MPRLLPLLLLLAGCPLPADEKPGDTADSAAPQDSATDTDGSTSIDTGPTDVDGDGYTPATGDCDELHAAIHPGAHEVCNSIDDNCDGNIDEGVLLPFYQDWDADGYGNPSYVCDACVAPAGYVVDATDCDDGDATISPGNTETCDGRDQDCDGLVDEDLSCFGGSATRRR